MKKHFTAHNLYLASISLKALNGTLEVIGAILILVVNIKKWPGYLTVVFREELIEDPNDIVVNWLMNTTQRMDINVQLFGFLYLLSHGLVKLFLVVSLLKKKLWAYPLSEVVLFFFVVYQTYLYSRNGSPLILFLDIVDILLIGLIWIEYKKVKANAYNLD